MQSTAACAVTTGEGLLCAIALTGCSPPWESVAALAVSAVDAFCRLRGGGGLGVHTLTMVPGCRSRKAIYRPSFSNAGASVITSVIPRFSVTTHMLVLLAFREAIYSAQNMVGLHSATFYLLILALIFDYMMKRNSYGWFSYQAAFHNHQNRI